MLKRWATWPQVIRWLVGIAAVVVALAIVWALFVPVPDWLARHDVGSAKGPLLQTARDAARGRLLTLGAGLFAAAALLFTARNFTLSREGQVTDRYTKAIEQLGSDKLDVRIGGIYALERVARDSARDHPTVMEVLAAFIREHSHEQWQPPDSGRREQERSMRPDVQAALTVVGRRDQRRDIQAINLAGADLTCARLTDAGISGADLRGATLTRAGISGANLRGAALTRADLTRAHLRGTTLTRAYLTDAHLTDAHLTGADLTDADLTRAHLYITGLIDADLGGADLIREHLTDADLTDADLRGANLTGARWPTEAPVPEGWKLDDASGRLEAAGTDSAGSPSPTRRSSTRGARG